MKNTDQWGFTLIELLTVIAIIAILAGMVFTVGPGIIARTKISSFMNTCNQLRTSCVGYYTKYRDTYPPAYGYKIFYASNPPPATAPDIQRFYLDPYMNKLQLFGSTSNYDIFSQSYDTDGDGFLSWLEFSPLGTQDAVNPQLYHMSTILYRCDIINHTSNLPNDVAAQLASSPRPITYVPVWRADAMKAVMYWRTLAQTPASLQAGWYALQWDAAYFQGANAIKVPPSKYDDFVLIGVGPQNNTGGLLTPKPEFVASLQKAGIAADDMYYYFALRTYFLASRDANGNGLWDFDFRNRTRLSEAKNLAALGNNLNLLPDGSDGAGPLIYMPNDNGLVANK